MHHAVGYDVRGDRRPQRLEIFQQIHFPIAKDDGCCFFVGLAHCNGKRVVSHEGFCWKDCCDHRGRHGHGPRAGAAAGRRGLQCRDVRYFRRRDGRDQAALRGRKAAAGAARHHACRRRLDRGPAQALPRRDQRAAGHRQDPSVVQQCRHRRRRQPVHQFAGAVGTDVQYLLGRRLSRRSHLPADADEGRRGPHRQHLQRQRLLGLGRHGRVAHRLQRRQIRGEGVYRSADQRSPAQRAAHQMLGGDARPYRHVDRFQFAQDPERHRIRAAERQ